MIDTEPVKVVEAAREFMLPAHPLEAFPFGNGHINETFQVTLGMPGAGPREKARVIIQRINTKVFRNPEQMMENISGVIAHLRRKLVRRGETDLDRRVLSVIPAKSGGDIYRDPEGRVWRAYHFIERASSVYIAMEEKHAFEAAKAFGTFLRDLSDMPGPIHETIPDFHHTPKRFEALEKAVKEDTAHRSFGCAREIDSAMGWRRISDRIVKLLAEGRLANRVTHNDTKVNNVLMDDTTGKGTCVIDLDTVMQGSLLYDFGDMVRTTTPPVAEDCDDHHQSVMRMHYYDALVDGFTEGTGGLLTPLETELLPFSGALITIEMGIRFLADHLNGDTYYRIHREGHNLARARTQLTLAESISAQLPGII